MNVHASFDPDLEWLDLLQPVGLVVGRHVLKELGLSAEPQTQADTGEVQELVDEDP